MFYINERKRVRRISGALCLALLLTLCAARGSVAAGKPGGLNLGVAVGELAPEFSFQDAKGKWVSLSDFRGKKVFLFSWATWCRCREQLPALQEFYKKNKSAKFEVIAVASDSQGFKWVQPYLDNARATYISLVDPNNELPVKYNFLATENGFLIDEGGVIRMSVIGFDIRKKENLDLLNKAMKTEYKGPATAAARKSLDERISELAAATQKDPKAFGARLGLGELYRQKGDYSKAEATLREAVALKKRSAEAHYRLGVILYQKGDIDKAVAEWEIALKNDSGNYIYMRNIEAYRNPEKFYDEMMKK